MLHKFGAEQQKQDSSRNLEVGGTSKSFNMVAKSKVFSEVRGAFGVRKGDAERKAGEELL